MFSSEKWFGGANVFYSHTINQSLRFEDGDTASLSDPSLGRSAGNLRTWTFSAWLKLSNLGSGTINYVFGATTDNYSANWAVLYFGSDLLTFQSYTSSEVYQLQLTQVFRDPSAWYHIVLAWDTTQATASDRIKIYVNGSQVTSFITANYPSTQNYEEPYINNNIQQDIGRAATAAYGYDGYMAEVNFIDGQALTPTSFGETKAGIWIPKNTSGLTFGSNGYRLQFQDNSSLGDDTSGNTGNDFTPTGLAATDVVLDSPTNNFANFNALSGPNFYGTAGAYSQGNLHMSANNSSSSHIGADSTIGVSSGKWYWEIRSGSNGSSFYPGIGIRSPDGGGNIVHYRTQTQAYINGNPSGQTISTYTSGDIIGVALDLDSDTNTLQFYKNGSANGTTFSLTSGHEWLSLTGNRYNSSTSGNFGADSSFFDNETAQGNTDDNGIGDFYYTPPSGFLALCTANLPDPAIDPAEDEEPADYFNTVLYSGDSNTTQNVGATSPYILGFDPDFTWIKSRSSASGHHSLIDSVRGDIALNSNQAIDEYGVGPFNSNANGTIDVPYYANDYSMNTNSETYVAWNWLAGSTASTITAGSISSGVPSIQSSVSANTKAGFSIVSYTGNQTAGATVGHGLSKTPEVIIVKNRDLATNWMVYHAQNTTAPETEYLGLNLTQATFDTSAIWNDTAPTPSVFSIGSGNPVNRSLDEIIAYCFHSVDGYSKFGSYTGSGSTSGTPGPFVYTGFRPAWVMLKRAEGGSGSWWILDSSRDPFNEALRGLKAEDDDDETGYSGNFLDFYANGFAPRTSGAEVNESGNSYIYLAFAEQPFKYANAR
tara:strand:- start:899 stop:3370 length:2472 start_codon:yes stop_codon:yes gene_type:complete